MSKEKRMAILGRVLEVAWADDDFDERELNMLNGLMDALGDDDEGGTQEDIEGKELGDILVTDEERLFCYQQVLKMSYADGVVVPEERAVLDQIKQSLHLSEADCDRVERALQAELRGEGGGDDLT